MTGLLPMRGGVTRQEVAAADVAAGRAPPQMHPPAAEPRIALDTAGAARGHGGSTSALMDRAYRHSPLRLLRRIRVIAATEPHVGLWSRHGSQRFTRSRHRSDAQEILDVIADVESAPKWSSAAPGRRDPGHRRG